MLERDPNHAKVLQQLGWLHHQQSNSFSSQEQAIEYLEKSVSAGKYRVMIHIFTLQALTRGRSIRCTELVSTGPVLHVTTEVS